MNLRALATAVAPYASTLATMLGGPLAGSAVAALEGAFGLKPGSGPDAITQVIQTGQLSPEQLAAVRAADQKHAEIIAEQKIDLVKINAAHEEAFGAMEAADRASARQREVAIKDHVPAILAYTITVGFFSVLGYIIKFGVPTSTSGGEAVLILLGSLGTAWTGIIAYYFGSSASSARKDKALADIARS